MSEETATADAKIYLVNGLAFTVALPSDPVNYASWLKIITADGFAVFGDLVIATPAIACIVRGALLVSMHGGAPMAMAQGERLN